MTLYLFRLSCACRTRKCVSASTPPFSLIMLPKYLKVDLCRKGTPLSFITSQQWTRGVLLERHPSSSAFTGVVEVDPFGLAHRYVEANFSADSLDSGQSIAHGLGVRSYECDIVSKRAVYESEPNSL